MNEQKKKSFAHCRIKCLLVLLALPTTFYSVLSMNNSNTEIKEKVELILSQLLTGLDVQPCITPIAQVETISDKETKCNVVLVHTILI